jgi:hypothetical protein
MLAGFIVAIACGNGFANYAFRVSPSILSFSMPKFNTRKRLDLLPIKDAMVGGRRAFLRRPAICRAGRNSFAAKG